MMFIRTDKTGEETEENVERQIAETRNDCGVEEDEEEEEVCKGGSAVRQAEKRWAQRIR